MVNETRPTLKEVLESDANISIKDLAKTIGCFALMGATGGFMGGLMFCARHYNVDLDSPRTTQTLTKYTWPAVTSSVQFKIETQTETYNTSNGQWEIDSPLTQVEAGN